MSDLDLDALEAEVQRHARDGITYNGAPRMIVDRATATALIARARRCDDAERIIAENDALIAASVDKWEKLEAAAYQVCGHCRSPYPVADGVMASHVRECPSNPLVADLAAKDARIAELEQERDEARDVAERRRVERAQALTVDTTEGMSASEWVMRTAKAEVRAETAEQERDAIRDALASLGLLPRAPVAILVDAIATLAVDHQEVCVSRIGFYQSLLTAERVAKEALALARVSAIHITNGEDHDEVLAALAALRAQLGQPMPVSDAFVERWAASIHAAVYGPDEKFSSNHERCVYVDLARALLVDLRETGGAR